MSFSNKAYLNIFVGSTIVKPVVKHASQNSFKVKLCLNYTRISVGEVYDLLVDVFIDH